ncbi:hypothetical protein Emed_002259 [Eimeria media]
MLLAGMKRASALGYIGDIILRCSTWDAHRTHLKQFFRALRAASLQLRHEKCCFGSAPAQQPLVLEGFCTQNVLRAPAGEPPRGFSEQLRCARLCFVVSCSADCAHVGMPPPSPPAPSVSCCRQQRLVPRSPTNSSDDGVDVLAYLNDSDDDAPRPALQRGRHNCVRGSSSTAAARSRCHQRWGTSR